MNERTRIKLLLVISFVVLSSTAFIPRTATAGNDTGGNDEVFEECLALAKQGDTDEQLMLGQMYFEGLLGAPQDYKEAMKWWRKAAEQGIALAQLNLGHMYINGLAVSQDYEEAAKWYRKAAEQGLVLAQFKLGQMYYNGIGGPQDYKEAVKWWRKAAEQGLAVAQLNLGAMYLNGLGVPLDYVESYAWLNISATQGEENASKTRDIVVKKLSSGALTKAKELSREYYKEYVKPFQ